VGKGVSEKFDENEADTARRAYSREIVERAKRTARMEKVDLERMLRTESGTRPAIGRELIAQHERESNVVSTSAGEGSLWEPAALERHVRAQMQNALEPSSSVPTPLIPAPAAVPDIDPHSRPTIEAFRPIPLDPELVAPSSQEAAAESALAEPAPAPVPAPVERRGYVSIPRWLLTVGILLVVMLVVAAGAVGFVLGRGSVGAG